MTPQNKIFLTFCLLQTASCAYSSQPTSPQAPGTVAVRETTPPSAPRAADEYGDDMSLPQDTNRGDFSSNTSLSDLGDDDEATSTPRTVQRRASAKRLQSDSSIHHSRRNSEAPQPATPTPSLIDTTITDAATRNTETVTTPAATITFTQADIDAAHTQALQESRKQVRLFQATTVIATLTTILSSSWGTKLLNRAQQLFIEKMYVPGMRTVGNVLLKLGNTQQK